MYQVKGVKIEVDKKLTKEVIAKKIGRKVKDITSFRILKRSIDARRDTVFYEYELVLDGNLEGLTPYVEKNYEVEVTGVKKETPIIIGSGPAGLFACYSLVERGFKPILYERGDDMNTRILKVEEFWKTGVLDTESNVQFGLGGAGTFSDGKLNTLIKDKEKRGKYVLETFVRFGADEKILYEKNAHIGTDKLREIILNMERYLKEKGARIYYRSCLKDIEIKDGHVDSIVINDKKIPCHLLILALGHSARDTFFMLDKKNILMESKPFAVGFRLCSLQEKVNQMQYGKYSKYLDAASYKITYQTKNRGVYSFCMCPGGFVVNASSLKNHLAINGMSNAKREEKVANSAIVLSVSKKDFGPLLFDGLDFVSKLEQKAYELGKGNIPIQLLKDYLENKESIKIKEVPLVVKGSTHFSNLNELLPRNLNEDLKEALTYFKSKYSFFSDDDILLGIESRTSSPIRIVRSEDYQSNILGIYPIGEGAGYAGGIMSASIDGLKAVEQICKVYRF